MPKSKPTKAQLERYRRLQEHGCMCCKWLGFTTHAEIHHLTAGYRIGNDATIPLCPWHHRGEPLDMDMPKTLARRIYGPSMALDKREFTKFFGLEQDLLREIDSWLKGESPQETREPKENESSLPF